MDTTVAVGIIAGASGLLGAGVGAAGATFGPLLLRRHEEKVADKREFREQTRASIATLHVLLDQWVEAHRAKKSRDIERLAAEIRTANVTFRLWVSGDDGSIAGIIYHVLSASDFLEAASRSASWHDVALGWFRGTIAGKDVEFSYQWYREEAARVEADLRAAGKLK